MRIAEIELLARQTPTQEKLMRKLTWRDSWLDKDGFRNEIIYQDIGGDIEFVYDKRLKRSVPYVVDVFLPKKVNSYEQIKKYVASLDVPHTVLSDIANHGITIGVEEEVLKDKFEDTIDSIEQDLFSGGFTNCDVRIHELV